MLRNSNCNTVLFKPIGSSCPTTATEGKLGREASDVFPIPDRGEWQANFYLAQVNHGFSCPIGISPDGTLGFGNCITAKNMTIVQPPSGILTIDRNCHVVGSITYGFSDDQWGGGVAQESFSCGALRMEAGCQERGISFAATKSAEFPKIGLFRLSWSQANDEACASSNGRASAGAFVCKLRGDKLNRLSDSQIPGAEL